MSSGKRNRNAAWTSFTHTPDYDKASLKLGNQAYAAKALYDHMYPEYETERELNKAFIDFVDMWADTRTGIRYPEKYATGQNRTIADAYLEYKKKQDTERKAKKESEFTYDERIEKAKADKELEKRNKQSKWTITPDKNLESSDDARNQAEIIKGITGVEVDPKNSKAALDAYKKIYDSGNLSDALKCKQAAENLESIYKKLWVNPIFKKGGKSSEYIEWYYKYAKGIADFEDGLLGGDYFGKGKETELEKLYKAAEKAVANMNTNSPDSVLSVMKLLAEDMEKELSWQEVCRNNNMTDKLKMSEKRHIDGDGSVGYGALWNKCAGLLNGFLADKKSAFEFSDAYLKYTPWPKDAKINESSDYTYEQLFKLLKDKLKEYQPVDQKVSEFMKTVGIPEAGSSEEGGKSTGTTPVNNSILGGNVLDTISSVGKTLNGNIFDVAKAGAKAVGKAVSKSGLFNKSDKEDE